MKKNNRLTALLLACFLVLSLAACGSSESDEAACRAVVENFETACHNNDLSGLLDCITPKYTKAAKAALKVAGFVTGDVLSDDTISSVSDILGSFIGEDLTDIMDTDFFSSVQLTITGYAEDGKERLVYVDITYMNDGGNTTASGAFEMEKKKGNWYIKGFHLT